MSVADTDAGPALAQPATGAVDAAPGQDAGVDARAPAQPDAGPDADQPPVEDRPAAVDGGSFFDWVSDLAQRSPQVREAQALQRIAAAIAAGASPSTIVDALEALDDIGCYANQETCTRVCQWARLNCDACTGESVCIDAIRSSCVIGCSL